MIILCLMISIVTMVTSTTDNINYKNTHINDIKLCLLAYYFLHCY
jgi:hypothetical protein